MGPVTSETPIPMRALLAIACLALALPAAAAAAGPQTALVLVVHPSVPAEALQKFRELAGEQRRGLPVAVAAPGSPSQRATAAFEAAAHVEFEQLPHKTAGEALQDLTAGKAAAMFAPAPLVAAAVRNKKLRALAVTGSKRLASLPKVPTFEEAGLAGFDPAAKGTP